MTNNTQIPTHRRNTLRHPAADYSDPGAYFITLCTLDRDPLFGEISNAEMHCNPFGAILWEVWNSLPTRYPQISIDTAIVMPDHLHGIIILHPVREVHEPPLQTHSQPRRIMTIPLIVGYLKMNTAKRINAMRNTPGVPIWHRNYFDRILRDDLDYDTISEYILTNPHRWGIDQD